jgi:seryl-tRNA synthetase
MTGPLAVADATGDPAREPDASALAGRLAPAGLGWQPSGQAVLTGPLYQLARACDDAFGVLAGLWHAEHEFHPAMIPAAALQRVDYLTSFPQLATFPVSLDPDEANLAAFAGRDPVDVTGAVALTRTAAVRDVLTPAACYHIFLLHEGERLGSPRFITTRNTCFRREAHYQPLRRQRSFQMREIVCLGTRAEVQDFLARARVAADLLLRELDLPVSWEVATDPFFQPASNPQYLAQRLQPSKHEALFGGDLAVSSVNLHEDHFGAAFAISRGERPATSGCVAFGIERWLHAIACRHGTDPAAWPDPAAAARRVAATLTSSADPLTGTGNEGGSP